MKYDEIRILPMSKKDEFENKSIKKVQYKFFLRKLPFKKRGKFLYKKSKMNIRGTNTLVLFQYDNHIIASARLLKIKSFKKPKDGYKGAYYFDISSIRIFKPLSKKEINNIFKPQKDIKFNQTKYILNSTTIENFEEKLNDFEKKLCKKVCICP